jgi:NitT/TauT family transport system permease protein
MNRQAVLSTADPAEAPAQEGVRYLLDHRSFQYATLGAATLAVWAFVASLTIPILLPSPLDVGGAFLRMISNGTIFQHVGWSYLRILAGWVAGCAVGVPLGILAGRIHVLKRMVEPYIDFFRFIPPIAFLTLSLIWFGLGELSKVMLIVYTTLFIVFLNTMTGALSVEKERIRAAQCLGATGQQVFRHVIMPATVPYIITGVRLAMGNSFMTVVAAEMIAAQSGVGFLIFSSRLFAQTDYVFCGIISLGIMGSVADLLLRKIVGLVAYRYDIKL